MAYETAGLYALKHGGRRGLWVLEQTDAKAAIVASGYITDAVSAGPSGAAGKGMKQGDFVLYQQVDTVGDDPADQTISDSGMYYVSAIDVATGAGTIVAMGAD